MRLRNRMVKAAFWTDPDLCQWPRDKREFYRSLWALADDSGCIENNMFGVKISAWPSPLDADMSVELFNTWRDELVEARKLIEYTAGGKSYLYIPNMAEHEQPRNPQSPDIPLPQWVQWISHPTDARKGKYEHQLDVLMRCTTGQNEDLTVPALPCPDLSSPVQPGAAYNASAEDDRQDGKSLSSVGHPPCLNADIEVIDPAYTGSCWGFIVGQAEAQFGSLLSHAERTELAEIMTRGCIPGCDGSHPQGCAVHVYDKLKLKGKTSFRTSRLWLKCLLEDRMEVRQ